MKKLLFPILAFCFGFVDTLNAANTDISVLNNIIYVEPFSAAPGTQMQMSIKMKNTVGIRGFQFDLYLPDGISAAKSSKGKILSSLTEDRLPAEDEHTLTLSEQGDGSIRFLCGSMADETFTGLDGEIATLTINVSGEMATGDYPVLLKNMKLTETDINHYYETELIETTVTVELAGNVIIDETSTTLPAAADGVNVTVKRNITANEWSTICLPFEMSESQVKSAFGNDVELSDFVDYDIDEDLNEDIVGIQLNFNSVTAIEANHPYLIKTSGNITEFDVNNVNISPLEDEAYVEYDNGKTGKKREVYGTFYGTLKAGGTIGDKCLFISGNKFWYSAGSTTIKAFRGFFDLVDVLADVDNVSSKISFVISDETNGIKHTNLIGNDTNDWHSIEGLKITGKPTKKGIYINNGKKIVIK